MEKAKTDGTGVVAILLATLLLVPVCLGVYNRISDHIKARKEFGRYTNYELSDEEFRHYGYELALALEDTKITLFLYREQLDGRIALRADGQELESYDIAMVEEGLEIAFPSNTVFLPYSLLPVNSFDSSCLSQKSFRYDSWEGTTRVTGRYTVAHLREFIDFYAENILANMESFDAKEEFYSLFEETLAFRFSAGVSPFFASYICEETGNGFTEHPLTSIEAEAQRAAAIPIVVPIAEYTVDHELVQSVWVEEWRGTPRVKVYYYEFDWNGLPPQEKLDLVLEVESLCEEMCREYAITENIDGLFEDGTWLYEMYSVDLHVFFDTNIGRGIEGATVYDYENDRFYTYYEWLEEKYG